MGLTNKDQIVSPEYRLNKKPTPNFRKELISILKYVPHLNSITFGYNGEPTLNEHLLDFLKIASNVILVPVEELILFQNYFNSNNIKVELKEVWLKK